MCSVPLAVTFLEKNPASHSSMRKGQGLICLYRVISSFVRISSASWAGGFMSTYLLATGVITVSCQVISSFSKLLPMFTG